ncbi:hypothetical protein BVC80_1835g789 [Macleaya cordata]|uniref:Uncharacterized protein n=1 Tax=Macleaya cordata TaxID=56857 RepID=A0A200R6N2_MACCD|nr:hypothetical protein BVC80_1835g789 [Macleaya cordata]
MYSELDEISLVGMSNSDLFLAEKDPKPIKFEFLLRPTLEFSDADQCQSTPATAASENRDDNDDQLHRRHEEVGDEDHKHDEERENKDGETKCEKIHVISLKKKLEMPSLIGDDDDDDDDDDELNKQDVDEDDDGFRTPTSLDKKIPVIPVLQCPPAPKKPKSRPSTKRKSSSSHHQLHRHFQILHDYSEEIESLFPPTLLADLGRKIKKARR